MKLLVDMNLSPKWIELLQSAGWEAVHWSTVGRRDAPDREIMAHAASHGFVVLTHDLDFGAILAVTHATKPSVALIRSDDVSTGAIGGKTVAALHQMEREMETGALLAIEADRTRLRLLPLKSED